MNQRTPATPYWHLFVPKSVTVLRQGYRLTDLRADIVAGLMVAIVALPLSMALAIASGVSPDRGLATAIVAGFFVSALGGSRFQIGGPTGAFVVVVFNVVAEHGYDGLVLATLMAGILLIAAGLLKLGTYVKYVPLPVVTGFTAGIAVIIFSSQVKDLLGLDIAELPADFLAKWAVLWAARDSFDGTTFAIALGSLALILGLRRLWPALPGFLFAVLAASAIVAAGGIEVDTIGSRFGAIPSTIPVPSLSGFALERIPELVPSAVTIAFLAGVESLLSAVVADGMTGRRHRSNCELVGQGLANMASALFGGMPATGAIARTVANIRSGARSPVAGMLHAVFLLLILLAAAPLAAYVPLAALAAILAVVAWNMSEARRVRHLLGAPWSERLVMLLTFALTVLVDLTVAIQVGVLLAAVMFMHRMAQAVEIQSDLSLLDEDRDDFVPTPNDAYTQRAALPEGVEVFQMSGPFFFGVARRLNDLIETLGRPPKVFILRMRLVPMMDATGATALSEFIARCRQQGTRVILSGVQPQPREILARLAGIREGHDVRLVADYACALDEARALVASSCPTEGRG